MTENLYAKVFEILPTPAFVFTSSPFGLLDVNEAALEFYGYERNEFLSPSLIPFRSEASIFFVEPSAFKPAGCKAGVWRHKKKDGTFADVEVLVKPIPWPGRKAFLAVIHDVSKRRVAESNLRRLSAQLLRVQDDERRQLARELHDSLAQQLAAISMDLTSIKRRPGSAAAGVLSRVQSLVQSMEMQARTAAYLLHPPELDMLGLSSSIRCYVSRFMRATGLEVRLKLPRKVPRLGQDLEITLFRIVQECLTNVHRHSGSSTASVRMVVQDHSVRLEVKDEGCGIPPEVLTGSDTAIDRLGIGIVGMQERVRQLHGRLEIKSGVSGTTIRAVLPRSRPPL